MNVKALGLATIAVATSAVPVAAHHSFAMFDGSKTTTLEGTIRQFQWTNPHSWIYLTVADAQGQPADWPIELGAPNGLVRQGWTPKTLTPGMKVKVLVHPLRDGKPGGQFMALTLPDGKQMGNPDGESQPAYEDAPPK
jgi:hypothetical protein